MPRRGRTGINWVSDSLTPTLATFTIRANVAISVAVEDLAKQMEQYMKENHPWENRTFAAEEGLAADVVHEGFRQVIVLHHGESVDYGIWLEIRWGGRYAIILPTIEHFEGEMWTYFAGVFPFAAVRSRL